eukprot:193550_1
MTWREKQEAKKKAGSKKDKIITKIKLAEEWQLDAMEKILNENKQNELMTNDEKCDLSDVNLQIKILNSDALRMKSILLMSKYDKIDENKYYGFMEFVEKELNDKLWKKILDKFSDNEIKCLELIELLCMIIEEYMMRLNKLKNNQELEKIEMDKQVIEHFACWLIRQYSNKMEHNNISKDNMCNSFVKWCKEYIDCNGVHKDSKLT